MILRGSSSRAVVVLAAFISLFASWGCRFHRDSVVSADKRNLVWFVVDTLRADALSCYGGTRLTPNIDYLARNGVLFERARSNVPITGPSHATMFTGLYPAEHGVKNNTQILDERWTTIAEVLRRNDFATAAVISLGNLQKRFGFDQGFEIFDGRFSRDWFLPADVVTDRALDALARLNGRRFFLFVHYSDPHEPYTPPGREYPDVRVTMNGVALASVSADGYAKRVSMTVSPGANTIHMSKGRISTPWNIVFRNIGTTGDLARVQLATGWKRPAGSLPGDMEIAHLPAELVIFNDKDDVIEVTLKFQVFEEYDLNTIRRRYLEEVTYVDQQIGRLLNEMRRSGVYEKSVILVTSDHGEGLGDHDLTGHVEQVYDSLLHVPLIIVIPGQLQGGIRLNEAIGLVNLYPTLLDILEVERDAMPSDTSYRDSILGTRPRSENALFAATFRPEARANLSAVIVDDHKLIRHVDEGQVELYDLSNDPGEVHDIATEDPVRKDQLARLLGNWYLSMANHDAQSDVLSPEEREALRALGYLK